MSRIQKTLCFSLLGCVLAFSAPAAVAPYFKVGVGDEVKASFSPFNTLASYLATDGIQNNFQTHWFHAGWKTHFPVAIAGGACGTGGEWSTLADYQGVLTAGRTLVIVWWWHGSSGTDKPCDAASRADAEATANTCLVPLLQSLNNGEVWVVFEPEYNLSTGDPNGTGGACGLNRIHRDTSWGTHINTMVLAAKGAAHAGLTVKAGPAIGGFGYDENVYNLEPSLENCYVNSDFIAYHHITRNDTYLSDPWSAPSPEAAKFSLSLSRYLRKRFNKPLFYAYWSSRNGLAGQAAQDADLKDHFANRAEFEADGVQAFGPYWYFDNGYPGEGLKSAPASPYTAFNTWKTEGNAVFNGSNGTHSIGYVLPDAGDIFDAPATLNANFISRGRPATPSTYNTFYSVDGGADQAFANPYSSGGFADTTNFIAPLSLCTIPPSANVRIKAVASDATSAYSRPFTVRNPNYSSNAQHKFDTAGQVYGWSGPNAWFSGGTKFTSTVQSSANWFHGGGAMELSGVFGNTAATQKVAVGTNDSITLAASDPRTINLRIYIPFDLNPSVDMGAAVSFLNYQVRLNGTIYDNYSGPTIPLVMGWNDTTITVTAGTGGTIDHVDLVFFNKWGQLGDAYFGVPANPKIYVDEIHYGGPVVFTPSGGCSSPTYTPNVTPTLTSTVTSTPTRTNSPLPGTSTFTPTNTPVVPSATPTPAAACTPDYDFESGTQGWVYDGASDTGFTAVSSGSGQVYQGAKSLQINAALTTAGAAMAGAVYIGGAGYPVNLAGRILTAHIYVPAGFSTPNYAQIFVKTGAGFSYSAATSVPLTGPGWTTLTYDLSAVATANITQQVGVKVGLSGGAPAFGGTLYLDSVDFGAGVCASPTPSFSPTRTMSYTRTPTPTPSITLTATPVINTATFTASPSITLTRTLSFTLTATPSRSATSTYSATLSDTPSRTASPTPSITLTGTPTRTLSFTITPSFTPSDTPLPGSPTFTMTTSPTPSITLTHSVTYSPSVTSTYTLTRSPTPTPSPTRTMSFTATPSATLSNTPLPGSPTYSPTVSPTPTNTDSFTASPTPSESFTPSATFSDSPTPLPPTDTVTQTSSPTPTASFSFSPTFSVSKTASPTPLGTLTATPTSSGTPTPTPLASLTATPLVSPYPTPNYGQVTETLPVFNPQAGPILQIAAKINGRADGFELRIYSKGYNMIGRGELSGSYVTGWHSLSFVMPELANGLWYYQIRAVNAGSRAGLPRVGKILILK